MPSGPKVERLEFKNNLLQQTTEVHLDYAVREARISSAFVKLISESLEMQCVGLGVCLTQTFGTWCGNTVPELKHSAVENILKWAVQCVDGPSRLALQAEEIPVVPTPSMMVAESGRQLLPWRITKGAALEKIDLKKMSTKNRSLCWWA